MPHTLLNTARKLGSHMQLPDAPISGFCVDTRTLTSGQLFIAMAGKRHDSHHFLAEAAAKGAAGAIISTSYTGPSYGLPLIPVPDTLLALQDLARDHIESSKAKVIAITGSLGKTTTRTFTQTLLESQFKVGGTIGNCNSQIGLPLALLNGTNGKEEVLVLEMGMTEPGNLTQLTSIAPPDIALLNSVALVHACGFDDLSHIARTKAEIFSHPNTRLGILHHDIGLQEEWKNWGSCDKVSFSLVDPKADFYLTLSPTLQMELNGQPLGQFKLPCKAHVHNLLAAVCAAHAVGMDLELIRQTIPNLKPPERRFEVVERKGITFINDSYNAAEISMKAALESIPIPSSGGRKIAVLGSMRELGRFSQQAHANVYNFAREKVDEIYAIGEEWGSLPPQGQLYAARQNLIDALNASLRPNDIVLLKGSNSHALWKLLDELSL